MRRTHMPMVLLVFIEIAAIGLLSTAPTSAQEGPTWLSFGGSTGATQPSLNLVSANQGRIELMATPTGAYADTSRTSARMPN